MKTYLLRSDTILDENGASRIAYGIDLPSENISVKDIFCNIEEAEAFVKTCNDLNLSPLHIQEVLDDLL